jgi:hypothetical protein
VRCRTVDFTGVGHAASIRVEVSRTAVQALNVRLRIRCSGLRLGRQIAADRNSPFFLN